MTDNWKTPKRFYDRLNEELYFDCPIRVHSRYLSTHGDPSLTQADF
jgi:hypothetical protein